MASNITRLAGTVRRRIAAETCRDITSDVVVEMTSEGIVLRGFGNPRRIRASWAAIAAAADPPGEMPAKYVGRHMDWITKGG